VNKHAMKSLLMNVKDIVTAPINLDTLVVFYTKEHVLSNLKIKLNNFGGKDLKYLKNIII